MNKSIHHLRVSAVGEDEDDRYKAPALNKGLEIIELLARTDGGLTQAEIAKRIGRKASEFFRMLDRLLRRGYVSRDEYDRYSLTLNLFGLAQQHAPLRRLAAFATPLMREFARQSSQATHLAVFDRGNAVVVAQQEAPQYWGVSIRVGSHISLLDTGSGHVLLAFRSAEERQLMISEEAYGRDEVVLTPEFHQRLDVIRERGYEQMASAQTAGIYNLAVPVLGPDGRGMAALACPYIPLRDAPSAPDIDATSLLLQATATQLSRLAGFDIGNLE
jgi:DNA-binding IclR family transcriptional regulator